MQLTIIRHAPVIDKKGTIYGDNANVDLGSSNARIEELSSHLPNLESADWYYSGVDRTYQTGLALFQKMGYAKEVYDLTTHKHEGFKEQNFGKLIGKKHSDVSAHVKFIDGKIYAKSPPGGESLDDFLSRVSNALLEVIESAQKKGRQSIVVFSHGGTIRAIHCILNSTYHNDFISLNTPPLFAYETYITNLELKELIKKENHVKAYGIDFGTTNSAVSLSDSNGVRILKIGLNGAEHIPSVFYFSDNKFEFGDAALKNYENQNMRGRLMRSTKTCLPDSTYTGTVVDGWGHCSIEKIISLALRDIKRRADKESGDDIRSAVIGRPAKFSEDEDDDILAQKRLEKAAHLAGFENVEFALEPIAAAYSYEQSLHSPEVALIADLGGGTSDFTIMRLGTKDTEDRSSDIIGVEGVYIGGDKLDQNLCRRGLGPLFGSNCHWKQAGRKYPFPNIWINYISEWHQTARLPDLEVDRFFDKVRHCVDDIQAVARLEALIRERSSFPLSRAVEAAKIDLSQSLQTSVSFERGSVSIRADLTRQQFEDFNEREVDRILSTVDHLLERTGTDQKNIETVFLTGGTSKVPIIRDKFSEKFGNDHVRGQGSFISVAQGLGIIARDLSR